MSSTRVGDQKDEPVGRRYRRRAVLRMASATGALCAGLLAAMSGCTSL